MTKVKLNKVELKNLPNVGVLVVDTNSNGAKIPPTLDRRTLNPGRPVNKQSARYKRLAKQAYYTKQNKLFVSGKKFYTPNVISGLHYSKNAERLKNQLNGCGSIFNELSEHVCTVNYIGRTKVQAFKYVLGKRVNVELNLKTLKYTA